MRLGLIGCGLIGRKRVAAAKRRGHDIVIAADIDSDRAAALAGEFGVRTTTDWREVIGADCEIVMVATSHDSLAEIAVAALEAGKHVLVEKPAGRNAAEVRALLAASRSSGRLVKVGFNHRFHPALSKAHAIASGGGLGPLLYIRGRYGHGGRIGYEREWRCQPDISGGGELIDQGSHLIDLARWFLGDLTLAYGYMPTYFWRVSVDDNCFLALKGSYGEMAWLHATWTEWKNMFSFEVTGRDGKLVVEGLGGSYGVERLTHHRMRPEMGPPETDAWEFPSPDNSWELELADFEQAIRDGRQPNGNIEDALANLELIGAAYGRSTP